MKEALAGKMEGPASQKAVQTAQGCNPGAKVLQRLHGSSCLVQAACSGGLHSENLEKAHCTDAVPSHSAGCHQHTGKGSAAVWEGISVPVRHQKLHLDKHACIQSA